MCTFSYVVHSPLQSLQHSSKAHWWLTDVLILEHKQKLLWFGASDLIEMHLSVEKKLYH